MLAKLSGTLLVSFGCVPKSFEDFNIYMQFGKGTVWVHVCTCGVEEFRVCSIYDSV